MVATNNPSAAINTITLSTTAIDAPDARLGGSVVVGGADTTTRVVGLGVRPGVGLATATFETVAEQMTSAPPPLVDPLHWLMVMPAPGAWVPLAVHVKPTSVPPLADPLHWVTVAPVVVAGNGSQPVVIPPPDPTHWFTVTATGAGATPTKWFVTTTLHLNVPPAPLVEALHCVTAVTGAVSVSVVMAQAAVGSPAAPWHSRTVTVAEPPPDVIVFTTVTSQIKPRPGVSSTPLAQVVVGAIVVAALMPAAEASDPTRSRLAVARSAKNRRASGIGVPHS